MSRSSSPRSRARCSSRSTTRSRCWRRRGRSGDGVDARRSAASTRATSSGRLQRLRDVVVRAELQAADLVGLGAARGDHEDRDAAELADPLDDLPAVETGQRDVEDDEVRVRSRRTDGAPRCRSPRGPARSPTCAIHSSSSAANSGSSSTMRIRSATGGLGRPLRRPASAPRERHRERHARAGPAIGPVADRQPPAVGLDETPADESPSPVPGIRDSRTFQARWNGSRTSSRSVVGDRRRPRRRRSTTSQSPSAVAPTTTGDPVRRVLQRVADEVLQHPPDAARVDVDVGGRSPAARSQTGVVARERKVAAQPRDERRERDRSALEDQRIGVEMGDVEDLVDERRRGAS